MSKGKQRRHILSHLKDRHSLDHPRGYLEKPEAALFYPIVLSLAMSQISTMVSKAIRVDCAVLSEICGLVASRSVFSRDD